MKGLAMHMITIVAAGSVLALSAAAQTQGSYEDALVEREPRLSHGLPPPPVQSLSVLVVDISALPKARQSQVRHVIAQRGEGELQKLQAAIDAVPSLRAALEARGLSSSQVMAAQTSITGRLTLVTRRKL
jgi:hypothetical protein